MNISEIFIRRPIATSLLMAGIALFGIVAYRALPVSDLPTVDFPTIQVQASLPGGDPGTMAAAVASPMERQFTTIAGMDSMISSSTAGSTQVTLQFDLARSMDSAAVDVQTAIAEAMPLLPAGLPTPPTFRKQNPADQDILQLALMSNTAPLSVLDDYAETVIAPRISMVSGVGQVQVWGQSKFAVRVQVDPDKLLAQQIGIDEVDQALQNWNVSTPTGQLFGPHQTYNIKAAGQLNNAEQFKQVIVAYRDGRPLRLEQVATVIDSVEDNLNATWFYTREGGQRAINLALKRQPGANTIEVTDTVRKLLPTLESQLPPSVHMTVRGDRSKSIRAAFTDIQWTMLITLLLVVAVIFLFLHNASATLIPALALPFSILGTFAVMELLEFSLNNLSMMALILSIGFVVDDAIVMLENIVRHIEAGEGRARSVARTGSKEIGFTILTMTTSLAAVFIPILFMGGILGPAVPRVRRHHHGRHPHLRRRLGHADADAVQPLPPCRAYQEGLCGGAGSRVRPAVRRLQVEPRRRPAPSSGHARRLRRGARGHRPHVRRRPERFHPRSGQRHLEHQHPGRAGDVVLRDEHGGTSDGRGRHGRTRPSTASWSGSAGTVGMDLRTRRSSR